MANFTEQTSTTLKSTGFALTRKNQKGQVAIFVALIFQVVFVFFALLINVGLLVHHKINLQNSADLAAYYGAMKQAEQMNAIAHINFQMRQAWKLMTWRYRVLGTFGTTQKQLDSVVQAGQTQYLPFDIGLVSSSNAVMKYLGSKGNVASANSPLTNGDSSMTCAAKMNGPDRTKYDLNGTAIGLQDIPHFCIGHPGFVNWRNSSETLCGYECDQLANGREITLPSPPNGTGGHFGSGTSNDIKNFITSAVNIIQQDCDRLNVNGPTIFASFMQSFATESVLRSETIKMLAANLSQQADTFVDLDGEFIKKGSERTFKNNLTGANFSGWDASNFQVYNGLSNPDCQFRNGDTNDGKQFLKVISFKFLNFRLMGCTRVGASGVNYKPESLYSGQSQDGINTQFGPLDSKVKEALQYFITDKGRAMIGYEKNPNCINYFAVKTFSEPTIPFLPLSKIRLEAVAVAKPFGGSIGPQYGKTWDVGSTHSDYTDSDPSTKVDAALPLREFDGSSPTLPEAVAMQPNFSLFMGDKLGLRNLDYLAAYHSMLAVRDINNYDNKNFNNYRNMGNSLGHPNGSKWPDYTNWTSQASNDMRNFDSLATNSPGAEGTRAIEITAIAPNQFDVFHYSIDPDFYNNYYVKIYKNFDKIKQASGANVNLTADQLRADFGAVDMDGSSAATAPMTIKTFSVKDQILVKNQVLDTAPRINPTNPIGSGSKYREMLDYLVSLQSSLLTSWTFLRFDDYVNFPVGPVNRSDKTMAFGECDDAWNKTSRATGSQTNAQDFQAPMNAEADNPPTPGNCVTGGRTGYSVKIVAPSVVSDSNTMVNPLDLNFFRF